jgi:3-phosphoinositide dependent protein kinase-1
MAFLLRFDDLLVLELLGEGSYSKVHLCTHKFTGDRYAVKIVNIEQTKQDENEIKVLRAVEHPSIANLVATFQKDEERYILLELCEGPCLFDYIKERGPLSLDAARFCILELINALEHIHSRNIVHRDIKPENCMMTATYHLKLTDFGTAKRISEKQTTNRYQTTERENQQAKLSFVGTAEYLAPEYLEDGSLEFVVHTASADMWAVGCFLYFLLCGKPPFRAPSEYLTFQKIKNLEYNFDEDNFPENDDARDLVVQLLKLDPRARLGFSETALWDHEAVREHKFFSTIPIEDQFNIHEKKSPLLPRKVSLKLPLVPAQTPSLTPPPPPEQSAMISNGILLSPRSIGTLSPRIPNGELSSPRIRSPHPIKKADSFLEDQHYLLVDWNRFLLKNETILFMSRVCKKRKLSVKKRQLIMTDFPRLFYVDYKTLEVKGTIPWSNELKVELKAPKAFSIKTPKRTYHFEDVDAAKNWVDLILELQEKTQF